MLDYLYSIFEANDLGAQLLLQVQKMDARNAERIIIDESHIAISPRISGEAALYMGKQAESRDNSDSLVKKILECIDNVIKGKISTKDVLILIEELLISMEQDINRIKCENPLMMLIALVLKKRELDIEARSDLCNLWIDGIRRVFSDGTFVVETGLTKVLFEQLNSTISIETENKLKLLVLDLLLYKDHNGLISEIANIAKEFLSGNEELAHSVLNTIVMLAKDEMDHQKYNAKYLENCPNHDGTEFIPNLTPKLSGVDRLIRKDDNGQVYLSHRDTIIAEYLYAESELKIDHFDMADYDLATLCQASNCGLKISDTFFHQIIIAIITCMVNAWHFEHQDYQGYSRYDVVDVIAESELVGLFRNTIVYSSENRELAIDLLFDEMDFSLFTEDAIEFYQKIFGNYLPAFIDAWKNPSLRNEYMSGIRYLEEKVNRIRNEHVRIEFYKPLFLYDAGSTMCDFSKCTTEYTYGDIVFLNEQFSKYGRYHLKEMLHTIYQLRIDKLLPHILISISNCFNKLKSDPKHFAAAIKDTRVVIQSIIYKAFVVHSTAIKQDVDLTAAYEKILETLVEMNYEDAAVLLDEFRLH